MHRALPILLAAIAAGCGSHPPTHSDASSPRATAALAFAHCMRTHGIPNWPDPDRNGDFDKLKLRRLDIPYPRIRAVEDRSCNITIPAAGGPPPTITPADRAAYLRAAACMRSHGVTNFPDPTFPSDTTLTVNIPRSINQDAPLFRNAARTCTKLIPAGLPYSSRTSTQTGASARP